MTNETPTISDPAGHRMGRPPRDLYGRHFGSLEALYRERTPRGYRGWLCRCGECGDETVYATGDLLSGHARCRICQPKRMGRPPISAEERLRRELAKKCTGRPSQDPNVQARRECEWRWEQAAQAFLGPAPPKPRTPKPCAEPQPKSDKQIEALTTAARMVAKLRTGLDAPQLAA